MAVFMGTRTNYLVARYKLHSKASWIVLVVSILIGLSVVEDPKVLLPVAVAGGGALTVKNGRKSVSRLVGETFYGCLFTFTGVFHSDRKSRGSV
tara:strand:- start:151 stop:432 length:282 start_codon:yes stop_codon:yes gene_type:complete